MSPRRAVADDPEDLRGETALTVAAIFVAYHAAENYLIGPWAYGGRLKLSNIAVVLAFVVGAEIAGVIGALIALPVAAVYPAIERIWLREQLPEEADRGWMTLFSVRRRRRRATSGASSGARAAPAR